MTDFHDPGGPSGTWAALERHPAPTVALDEPMKFYFTPGVRPIRGWLVDGEPMFVASDLAEALDYRMASDMTRRLDADEKGTRSVRTPGGTQNVTVVTESGLYTAIFGSRIPGAADFKRWVTREVLPAIRKTGSYSVAPTPPPIPAPEPSALMPSHAEALRGWADTLERAELAESKARELAVPASAWIELAESSGDYSVADASKVLSRDPNVTIRERALFQFMSGLGWVFKRDGRWKAYRTQLETGRLAEKVARPYWHEGRQEMVAGEPTVRITPKGLAEIHRRLGGTGQLALVAEVTA